MLILCILFAVKTKGFNAPSLPPFVYLCALIAYPVRTKLCKMRSFSFHLLPLLLCLSLASVAWSSEPPRPIGFGAKTYMQGLPWGDKRSDNPRPIRSPESSPATERDLVPPLNPRLNPDLPPNDGDVFQYRVHVTHTEGGVVDVVGYPTRDAVSRGVELVAISRPLSSYRLVSLEVNGEDAAGPLCFRVMGNCEISATFVRNLPDVQPVSREGEVTAVEDGETPSLCIALNPANEGFYVHGLHAETEANLYSLSGMKLRRLRVRPHEKVSLRGLPSGGYVLRLPHCALRFVKR